MAASLVTSLFHRRQYIEPTFEEILLRTPTSSVHWLGDQELAKWKATGEHPSWSDPESTINIVAGSASQWEEYMTENPPARRFYQAAKAITPNVKVTDNPQEDATLTVGNILEVDLHIDKHYQHALAAGASVELKRAGIQQVYFHGSNKGNPVMSALQTHLHRLDENSEDNIVTIGCKHDADPVKVAHYFSLPQERAQKPGNWDAYEPRSEQEMLKEWRKLEDSAKQDAGRFAGYKGKTVIIEPPHDVQYGKLLRREAIATMTSQMSKAAERDANERVLMYEMVGSATIRGCVGVLQAALYKKFNPQK